MMDFNKIKEEKKQLEQQREQLIAQLNQITGVITYMEKLILEGIKSKDLSDKPNQSDIPEKQKSKK